MARLDELLGKLYQRSHRDLMPLISAAQLAQQQQRMIQVGQRMDAQVDAKLKANCPDYEPPDSDMGDVNIYAGLHASDQTLQSLGEDISGGAPPTGQPAPAQSQQQKPSAWKKAAKLAATGVAIAGLGAGGAVVANKVFPPDVPEFTDTANEFDLSSPPFDPNQ